MTVIPARVGTVLVALPAAIESPASVHSWNHFSATAIAHSPRQWIQGVTMDVQKAGMARLLLAAPNVRDSAWMIHDLTFLKLCEVYEHACLRRDVLRCAASKDDAALLKSEEECKSLEAAAIAYIRERQKFSSLGRQ